LYLFTIALLLVLSWVRGKLHINSHFVRKELKMSAKSLNKGIPLLLATILVVILAISRQPAIAKDDPNTNKTQPPQHKHSTFQSITERLQYLTDKLNLTEEQKKALLPILENRTDEIHRLKHDESLSTNQLELKIMATRQKAKQKIIKLLTPDQQTTFIQLKEEFLDDFNSHVAGRLKFLSEELKITEDQKKTIRPILQNESEEIHAVRYNDSLTLEQQYRTIKAIRQKTHEQINNLLTPQQQTKYAEIKDETPQAAPEDVTNRMEKLTGGLNLTEEQKKAVKTFVENELKDIQTAKDDNSLTAKLRLRKIKTIHQQAREQISKLLTPDQQIKFQQAGG